MQDLWQLVGLGIVASVLAVTLRNWRPEMALLVSLATAVLLFLLLSTRLSAVVATFN